MVLELYRAAIVMPINSNCEMLLQKKDIGYIWNPGLRGFFGGKIEKGESPEGALRREVGEELGKKRLLENINYFGKFPFMDVNVHGKKREGIIEAYSADFIGNYFL